MEKKERKEGKVKERGRVNWEQSTIEINPINNWIGKDVSRCAKATKSLWLVIHVGAGKKGAAAAHAEAITGYTLTPLFLETPTAFQPHISNLVGARQWHDSTLKKHIADVSIWKFKWPTLFPIARWVAKKKIRFIFKKWFLHSVVTVTL